MKKLKQLMSIIYNIIIIENVLYSNNRNKFLLHNNNNILMLLKNFKLKNNNLFNNFIKINVHIKVVYKI